MTALPEPHLDKDGQPIVFTCPTCSAINIGMPPHGEKLPCPLAIEMSAAKIAADQGTAMMANDVFAAFKKMGLLKEEDD